MGVERVVADGVQLLEGGKAVVELTDGDFGR
jgi:hypothetical protein